MERKWTASDDAKLADARLIWFYMSPFQRESIKKLWLLLAKGNIEEVDFFVDKLEGRK